MFYFIHIERFSCLCNSKDYIVGLTTSMTFEHDQSLKWTVFINWIPQLWPQNMQDLGVCEDIFCQDDFNMPDIGLTFCNFEDLFGGDQDPIRALLGDKDFSCSSLEKEMSVNKSDNGNGRPMEVRIMELFYLMTL